MIWASIAIAFVAGIAAGVIGTLACLLWYAQDPPNDDDDGDRPSGLIFGEGPPAHDVKLPRGGSGTAPPLSGKCNLAAGCWGTRLGRTIGSASNGKRCRPPLNTNNPFEEKR